jgi:phosphotransferase system  glucose/maltose/N-acetylglucosamine-specific IIC component
MNPAFVIIVILICIAVWFLASSLYKPIGRWIGKIGNDAIETMKEEDKNEQEKEE